MFLWLLMSKIQDNLNIDTNSVQPFQPDIPVIPPITPVQPANTSLLSGAQIDKLMKQIHLFFFLVMCANFFSPLLDGDAQFDTSLSPDID